MIRFLRHLFFACLSPALLAASISLAATLPNQGIVLLPAGGGRCLPVAVAVYILLRVIIGKPVRIYVFGHEMGHFIAAKMTGKKVVDAHISADGRSGWVLTRGTNMWIRLAPYAISSYNILLCLLWLFLSRFHHLSPLIYLFLAFMMVSMNADFAISGFFENQPDLDFSGRLFASAYILFAAILWIPFLLWPAASGVGVKTLLKIYLSWLGSSYRWFAAYAGVFHA